MNRKKYYPNKKTKPDPADGSDKNNKKEVAPGALVKAFGKIQDLANDFIVAVTDFRNARTGQNDDYWLLHNELARFGHNRLYLRLALLVFLVIFAAEIKVSYEMLATFGIVVALAVVILLRGFGISGTALVVRGWRSRHEAGSQSRALLVGGALLLLLAFATMGTLSYVRYRHYAAYGDFLQHTAILPVVLFVCECVVGFFVERYVNYWSLKREQDAIIQEWRSLLSFAHEVQKRTRVAWGDYSTLYEIKHGYPPDPRQEATDQILYALDFTLTEQPNLDEENPAEPQTPPETKEAAEPAPDQAANEPKPEDKTEAEETKTKEESKVNQPDWNNQEEIDLDELDIN